MNLRWLWPFGKKKTTEVNPIPPAARVSQLDYPKPLVERNPYGHQSRATGAMGHGGSAGWPGTPDVNGGAAPSYNGVLTGMLIGHMLTSGNSHSRDKPFEELGAAPFREPEPESSKSRSRESDEPRPMQDTSYSSTLSENSPSPSYDSSSDSGSSSSSSND